MHRSIQRYRATPHCTTGKSRAEMLFNRKMRTEIASIVESYSNSKRYREEVEIRDKVQKGKIKYAYDRRHARDTRLDVDDAVCMKHRPNNKSEAVFNPNPYQITGTKGTVSP